MFRSSALIPSLTIGTPATLQNAGSVKIYALSTDTLTGGTSITSSVPDTNSDRLILDTKPSTGIVNQSFEKVSLNTGLSAFDLQKLLIQISSGDQGTNWINYDLRSMQNQLGITDYTDTTVSLYFGLTDVTPITLISSSNMTGAQGFVQIPNAAVNLIAAKSGTVFLVINFDTSNNSVAQGSISSETDTQPIVFDLFSFGNKNNKDITNGIYRFELQETALNSAISPIFYYISGSRDWKEIVIGTAGIAALNLSLGWPAGYTIDLFRDLTGIKKSERIPSRIRNLGSGTKKGLATLALAGSLAVTAGIYGLTQDKNETYQPQPVIEQLQEDYQPKNLEQITVQ